MKALPLHTGALPVNWDDKKRCISVVEAKIVTTTVKHIDIPVYFIQYIFDNGLFISKYDNSSIVLADMCTKPCSGPIISRSTKWITELRLYPTMNTEQYQLIILH